MENTIIHSKYANTVHYLYNSEYNCIELKYETRTYFVDIQDSCDILNLNKHFILYKNEDEYPSYIANSKHHTLIQFIYKISNTSSGYEFMNNNKYDLRRCNVKIYHKFNDYFKDKNVVKYIPGHYFEIGKTAYEMKNPIWVINENENNIYFMYCEKDTLIKLCQKSYEIILDFEKENHCKMTWFKGSNGYIMTHLSNNKLLYIHQVITGCYGNGRGTSNISVDHIDEDPLNNTYDNLRIATREEQEQNSKGIKQGTKRERQKNAQALPDGITQDMLHKYVVYYKNWLNKEKTKYREYFRIEKHPLLEKCWETTKSNDVSIQDKLKCVIDTITNLEKGILPMKPESSLPKYIFISKMRNKNYLSFEKRTSDKRLNMKMVLPDEYTFEEQLQIFNEKIIAKYSVEHSVI
jgi:hypothetical protein